MAKIIIDLRGILPFQGITFVPTGIYRGVAVECEPHKKEGESEATSILLKVEHTDKGFEGIVQHFYLGLDFSKKGVKQQWLGALISMGLALEKAQQQLAFDSLEEAAAMLLKNKKGEARKYVFMVKTPMPGADGSIKPDDVDRSLIGADKYVEKEVPTPFPAGYGQKTSGSKKGAGAAANGATEAGQHAVTPAAPASSGTAADLDL